MKLKQSQKDDLSVIRNYLTQVNGNGALAGAETKKMEQAVYSLVASFKGYVHKQLMDKDDETTTISDSSLNIIKKVQGGVTKDGEPLSFKTAGYVFRAVQLKTFEVLRRRQNSKTEVGLERPSADGGTYTLGEKIAAPQQLEEPESAEITGIINSLKISKAKRLVFSIDGLEINAEQLSMVVLSSSDYDYDTLAALSGTPVGTVKTRINFVRKKLVELRHPTEFLRPWAQKYKLLLEQARRRFPDHTPAWWDTIIGETKEWTTENRNKRGQKSKEPHMVAQMSE